MNRFRFNLESVLDIRRSQETAAQQELAAALQTQAGALARWQEAMEAREQLLQRTSAAATSGAFNAADRQRNWSVQQTHERHCLAMRNAHLECEKAAAEKRALFLLARRNRELLDRLKTTRREAAAREAALAEQNLFDEIAMSRRHRSATELAAAGALA